MTLETLDSTAAEQGGATARRIALGAQLRRLREAAQLTRAEAGYIIRASESKMSRLEAGKVSFKRRDVEDLLAAYGVADERERLSFLEMAEHSNETGWWHRYTDVVPRWFNFYIGLEESASRIQTYENQFVPGLLQTPDYVRAIMDRTRQPSLKPEEIERRIVVRQERQRLLMRPDAPRLSALLDESVLHRGFGQPRVLKAQIDALLEAMSLPHISVQIIRYDHAGIAESAFTVLRFREPELPAIAYVEHLSGALYLDRRDDVDPYLQALDQMAAVAETPENSRQLLESLRAEI